MVPVSSHCVKVPTYFNQYLVVMSLSCILCGAHENHKCALGSPIDLPASDTYSSWLLCHVRRAYVGLLLRSYNLTYYVQGRLKVDYIKINFPDPLISSM